MESKEFEKIVWKAYPVNDLNWNALGLCAEAGEFANLVKKQRYKEVSEERMKEELGDVLWHIAQCVKILDTNISTLMEQTAKKTRIKNGY